jgi:hypothetical protein
VTKRRALDREERINETDKKENIMKKQNQKKIRRSTVAILALAALGVALPASAGQGGSYTFTKDIGDTPSLQLGNTFTPAVEDAFLTSTISGAVEEPQVLVERAVQGCALGYSPLFALRIVSDSESLTVDWTITGSVRNPDGTLSPVPVGSGNQTISRGGEGDFYLPICYKL